MLSQLVGGGAEQLGTVSMDGEALAARVVERRMRALLETLAAAGDGHRAGRGGRPLWDGAGYTGRRRGLVAGPTAAVLLERVQLQHQQWAVSNLVGINNTA